LTTPNYEFLDRLVHRLALKYASLVEVSFDVDQVMAGAASREHVHERHVFISGLARSGSTVLMRRFHETGLYRSLTYRDMPFVLAPNMWRQLSLKSHRQIDPTERAHGDGILTDYDSPESFDEVFWRVFSGKQYIMEDCLRPHEPSADLRERLICYVNAILRAHSPKLSRYLSKNNNNILRLAAIRQTFPEALILIPFREPLQQAASLLRQHARFCAIQAQHRFVLDYMGWLGHHEFGIGHRPFKFGDAGVPAYPVDTLDYWLHLWCEAHHWLERTAPETALLICYDDLCNSPQTWSRLAELADIPEANTSDEPLTLSRRSIDDVFDMHLANRATALYARLTERSRAQLGWCNSTFRSSAEAATTD
jgi:Sulfotransferase family